MSTYTSDKLDKLDILLEKYYELGDPKLNRKLASKMDKLPTLCSYPVLDDSHLQQIKAELDLEMKYEYKYEHNHEHTHTHTHKRDRSHSLIKKILFLTYVQFVLSLIESGDKRAKYFIDKSATDPIVTTNARINFWSLTIPSEDKIKRHLRELSSGSKFYDVLKQLADIRSKERSIISKKVQTYDLVEIIENDMYCNDNVNSQKIFYSYTNAIMNLNGTDNLFVSFGCENIDLKIDSDCAVYSFVHKVLEGYTPHYMQYSSCDTGPCSITECEKEDADIQQNICIDITIILLYILVILLKPLNIDPLEYLSADNRLSSRLVGLLTAQ